MARSAEVTRPHFISRALRGFKQQLGILFALFLLIVIASFVNDRFLTVPNLLNVLRQVAIVGILAIGQTFVILTKGIDLSVGSILGLSVVFFAGLLSVEPRSLGVRGRS